jgi:hypothetical protein
MNYLALFGMTNGEFVVFLTALGAGITSLITAFFAWKGKKDALDFELKRMEREEERIEFEAKAKEQERKQIADEKQKQHIRDVELARLTRETAKGIQQSISRTSKEVKGIVEESRKERKEQIEEVKAMTTEAITTANGVNGKILDVNEKILLLASKDQSPLPVEVTNFPEEQQK